ncbi:hypothetical protein Hanom_Chr09g00838581 [Helianthus anomalus]
MSTGKVKVTACSMIIIEKRYAATMMEMSDKPLRFFLSSTSFVSKGLTLHMNSKVFRNGSNDNIKMYGVGPALKTV